MPNKQVYPTLSEFLSFCRSRLPRQSQRSIVSFNINFRNFDFTLEFSSHKFENIQSIVCSVVPHFSDIFFFKSFQQRISRDITLVTFLRSVVNEVKSRDKIGQSGSTISKSMKTEKEIAVVLPFAAIMGLCARVGTAFRDLFPFRLSGEVPRRVELTRKCPFPLLLHLSLSC